MILPDKKIKELIEKGSFSVEPLGEHSIQPASLDCTLGNHFSELSAGFGGDGTLAVLDLDHEVPYRPLESDEYVLGPKEFVLATTREYFRFGTNVTAFVEGRSSIGRLGLFVENAGWIDPGFHGQITLELFNASRNPIRLRAGRRICQLVICELADEAERPYTGKYLGQRGAVGTRVNQDAEVTEQNGRITMTEDEWVTILHQTYFDNMDHWALIGSHDPGLGRLYERDPEGAKQIIFKRLGALRPNQYSYHA